MNFQIFLIQKVQNPHKMPCDIFLSYDTEIVSFWGSKRPICQKSTILSRNGMAILYSFSSVPYFQNELFILKPNSASIFFWETSKVEDSCFGSETDKNRKRIEETASEQIRIQSLDQIKKVRPPYEV